MQDKYSFFTSKEVKPQGWLLRQLQIQAEGLGGHLDKIWPDIRDSAWIGGNREGWERVPYWLDGFVPLAYLLGDEDKIARAKKYIDKIIENQEEDGWICPNGNVPREHYDTWAVALISKVLVVYYDCSRDERVPTVIYKVMRNYYDLLSAGKIRLFQWGEFRWFEFFVALRFLKERHSEETWIDELARLIKAQGTDYESLTELWKQPSNRWSFKTHIVNLCMMFKSEAISAELLGEDYTGLADRLYAFLKKYNGTVTGGFTGDECLSGLSPIQGTELCAVVELMYSCEWLYAVTGDRKWAELLEMQAFNALPATFTDDMWAHQYVQMSNQIDCTPFGGNPPFGTNNQEAHLFGLEPHYGCCTSNFSQGWPKLAIASFMKAKDGVVSAVPVPAAAKFVYKNAHIEVSLETNYPFENSFVYKIQTDRKTGARLHVRIPSFAKALTVNGEPVSKKSMLTFGGFEAGETVIALSYDTEPCFVGRPYGMRAVKMGSLIFSLPLSYEMKKVEYTMAGVERKFPYCDYHISGKSDWNYSFASNKLTVKRGAVGDIPFSSTAPALTVEAELAHVNWGCEPRFDNACAVKPQSRKMLDAPKKVSLYPFGATVLRVTEMPKGQK